MTARSEIDYTTVLALLSEIASRAPELRASILEILCSPGQPQDLRVAALAAKLGRKIRTEDLSKIVTNIANQLPFQVWVGNGEPPEFKLSVFGTLQAVIEEKLVRVAILSGVELDFLLCYKDDIPETEWSTLLDAVLQMIEHPLNTRRNRILQIDFVTSMRDRLTPEQARTAIATIWKFADATAAPSPSDLPQPTTMDAFKFNTPTPGQLEGVAIGAVAKLSVRVSDDTGVERLLKPALLHVDPFVRALACMLLAELTISTRETDALIVASAQDTDVTVASAALHSVRVLYERGDIADLTALLIALSQRCFRSKDPIIRRHSVRLSVALHTQVSYPDQKAAVSSILNSAEKDPHFSVRSAAKEIPIAAGGSNQNVVSR
jgi:hypothetical protein